MNRKTLRDRLATFLRKQHGWIAKEQIIEVAKAHTSYSSENVGRRLRELAEDGVLEVKPIKGHAHYRFKEQFDLVAHFEKTPEHV